MDLLFVGMGLGLIGLGLLNASRLWKYWHRLYEIEWRWLDRKIGPPKTTSKVNVAYHSLFGPNSSMRSFNERWARVNAQWVMSGFIVFFGVLFMVEPFRN